MLQMNNLFRAPAASYGVALAAVALATLARGMLDPLLGDNLPYTTFLLAVAVAGWHGGLGPALFATVIGFLLAWGLFVPPRWSFEIQRTADWVGLIVFLIVGLTIASVSGAMRSIQRRALDAEHRARDQAELVRVTLASIGDGVIATDTHGCITTLNGVAEALVGWTNAEALGQPLEAVFRIVNEETRQTVDNPVTKALRDGVIVGLANHTVLICRDGTERPIDDSAAPIRAKDGAILGCILVFRDMTNRQKAERALRESEQRLRLAQRVAKIGTFEWNIQTGVNRWTPELEAMYGLLPGDFVGTQQAWEELIHPEDRSHALRRVQDAMEHGEFADEWRVVWSDGSTHWLSGRGLLFKDEAGKPLRLLGVNIDITERRNAEEELRRNERELADFFDNSMLGLHWVGPDGTILRANPAELQLLGYSAEEYVGHNIAEFHADQNVIADIMRRLESGEEFNDYEARLRRKDGSLLHVLIDSNVLWRDDQFIHSRCFTRDITDRREAELHLRQSEERYRALVQQIKDHAIFRLDTEGRALTWNEGVQQIFGFTEEEFVGAEIGSLVHASEDIRDAVPQTQLEIASLTGSTSHDRWMMKKDGSRFWAAGTTNALRDEGGLVIGFSVVVRDRTELKLMEEKLRQLAADLSEADRRKDEFLAILAHELRNPLAPVTNAVQILRLKGPDTPELRWGGDVIERQVSHLTRLIDDLLDISRITRNRLELRKQRIELAAIIQGAVESSRPLIAQCGHSLIVSLPDEPIYLDGDLVRLAQVFMNLLNNAAKYTEPSGRIWLTAQRQQSEVVISVKDTGMGIPAAQLPRLFEMFFQVDPALQRSQGGLGIGLSLVRRLVELHGGSVEARSEGKNMGSEFIVRLPVSIEQPEQKVPQEAVQVANKAVTTRRCIVVVDDNPDSAESLAMLLQLWGNDVHTALDGLAGVEQVERLRPDAVLLDIGMPKLNGYEACRRIRAQSWGKGVVLIALTGWGQDVDRQRTQEAGFNAHMVKPVDPAELTQLLGDLLPPDRSR